MWDTSWTLIDSIFLCDLKALQKGIHQEFFFSIHCSALVNMNFQRRCKVIWLNISYSLPRTCTKQINRLFVYFKFQTYRLSVTFTVIYGLLFCNMDWPCGLMRLAISIKSGALAVCANIISNTLKAPIITEQEPLWSPANARLWIKIFHVCMKKDFDLMTDSVANSSGLYEKVKHSTK